MRILHLLSQTELTGAEVYAQNLIESQVKDGHQVFVISDKIHVPLPIAFQSLPLSVSKLSTRVRNIRALRDFLKAHQIEVIHCHSRGAVRHAFWARAGLSIGLVTTLHGRQHFSWSKRLLHSYGEIQIAICENVKKAMELDFKMPGSPIRILRNPVSCPASQAARVLPPTAHLALIGRSSGPKGARFEKIAESCFQTWLETVPGLQISIIAPNPERFSKSFQERFENLSTRYSGRLHLRGHISNLRGELRKFSLVMASGRIAIESLLDQVPTLALGEYCSHGLVRLSNLSQALESNFGDIGSEAVEIPLDVAEIQKNVLDFFLKNDLRPDEQAELQNQIANEFDEKKIQKGILEAYRAAIFKRWVPHWTPALMYHKVPDEDLQSQHRIFIKKENFEKHLRFFARKNFQSLTFRDLKAFWLGEKSYKEFPKKSLLLTFDDGYKDNLTTAEPLLKKYGFKATIFLLGNHHITENTWDAGTGEAPYELMTFDEKRKLNPQVWEIGSHGFDHLHLTQVRQDQAMDELERSRIQLQNDFKQDVVSFAYPFGSTNEQMPKLAEKAGYSFAVNTDQGGLHLADQPYSIFRVNIFPEDGTFEIWKKTSRWYRKYFYRKRGR